MLWPTHLAGQKWIGKKKGLLPINVNIENEEELPWKKKLCIFPQYLAVIA
jgi:hypothetical protein